jgi:hypothetical protein
LLSSRAACGAVRGSRTYNGDDSSECGMFEPPSGKLPPAALAVAVENLCE